MAASLRVSSGEALRLLRADGSMHQHSLVSGRENTINVFCRNEIFHSLIATGI